MRGIDPYLDLLLYNDYCLPRMRGDRPRVDLYRRWLGFVYPACAGIDHLSVTNQSEQASLPPACAGIDLCCTCCQEFSTGLPRMRGDRPRSS